jgi:hypothetical protein
MKKLFLTYSITLSLVFSTFISFAQSTQSSMYDALTLMNVQHGVDALLIPNSNGFKIVDPITGNVISNNTTVIPDSLQKNEVKADSIIIAILRRQSPGLKIGTPVPQVLAAYNKNPFLKNAYVSTDGKHLSFLATTPISNPAVLTITNSSYSGAAGANILGNLSNGVADLLLDHVTQEISISVFQKLQTFLKQYPEFSVLFPNTLKLLKPVQAYDYAKTLKSLKAALQQDLDGLPANLPQLYQLPRYQLLNEKVPELTLVFASSQLFSELHGKSSLGRSLHDLDTASCLKASNNYVAMIKLVDLLSNSMRKKLISDNEDGDYAYFSAQDLIASTKNNPASQVILGNFYLGLIYQQAGSQSFYSQDGAHPLSEMINDCASKSGQVIAEFIKSTDKLNNLETALANLKSKDQAQSLLGQNVFSADRFTLYNQVLVASLQFIQPFVEDPTPNEQWKMQITAISTYWPQFSSSGIQMIKDISAKNYNLAINDLSTTLNGLSGYLNTVGADKTQLAALNTTLSASLTTQIKTINASRADIATKLATLTTGTFTNADIQSAVTLQVQNLRQQDADLQVQLKNVTWEQTNGSDVLKNFTKILSYIDLLAALSQADNSQEVEAILENYVLPAGSSRVKKESPFSIEVNAYVGGFYRPNTSGSGFTNEYGLTAPIGVTFNFGFKGYGSLSAFISPIDIGSIIQYKLDNQGQYEQNINFVGLVSPTVQVVYGIAYTPLSIGAGYQWTSPQTVSSNDISLKAHFNIFLAFDIPLFNLYVKKPKATTN